MGEKIQAFEGSTNFIKNSVSERIAQRVQQAREIDRRAAEKEAAKNKSVERASHQRTYDFELRQLARFYFDIPETTFSLLDPVDEIPILERRVLGKAVRRVKINSVGRVISGECTLFSFVNLIFTDIPGGLHPLEFNSLALFFFCSVIFVFLSFYSSETSARSFVRSARYLEKLSQNPSPQ